MHRVARLVAHADAHRLAVVKEVALAPVVALQRHPREHDRDGPVDGRVKLHQALADLPARPGLVLGRDEVKVLLDDRFRPPERADLTRVEPDRTVAEALDRAEIVRHEHERLAGVAELEHALVAARAEALVADGQHLVDQQHVGVDVHRDREPEPGVHPARVRLDRVVRETLELGEGDDLVDARAQLFLREPVDRTGEEDVLDGGVLGVEAGADLEQRRDPPADAHAPGIRTQDPREHLQHRALARAVATENAERLPGLHRERDVVDGPELLELRPLPPQKRGL